MKKLINITLIFLLSIGSNLCFANEDISIYLGQDYLITTEKNVKSSFVSDSKIVTLSPFFTIFNEKNVLLLHPVKVGKTDFTIFLDNSDAVFNVVVKPFNDKTPFNAIRKGIFEFTLLDAPPDFIHIEFEFDKPPMPKKEAK